MSRRRITLLAGVVAWLLGLASVLSFNVLSDYHPLGANVPLLGGKTIFDALDYLTQNIMLPVGGILVAVFVGWVMRSADTSEELARESHSPSFRLWQALVRVVAPLAIAAVLVFTLLGVA